MIKTAGFVDDGFELKQVRVDSIENVRALLDDVGTGSPYSLIEPLFCSQGCINGPGINTETNLFERRKDIIEYDNEKTDAYVAPEVEDEGLFRAIFERKDIVSAVTEEEILASTGKNRKSRSSAATQLRRLRI